MGSQDPANSILSSASRPGVLPDCQVSFLTDNTSLSPSVPQLNKHRAERVKWLHCLELPVIPGFRFQVCVPTQRTGGTSFPSFLPPHCTSSGLGMHHRSSRTFPLMVETLLHSLGIFLSASQFLNASFICSFTYGKIRSGLLEKTWESSTNRRAFSCRRDKIPPGEEGRQKEGTDLRM